MRWETARAATRCTSQRCQQVIPAGTPLRRVGPNWAICPACAVRRLDEAPPAHIPVAPPDRAPDFTRVRALAQRFAVPSREPGEEG